MGQEMGPNGRELGLDGDRLVRLVRETPNTRIVDTPCSQRHGILGWSVCPSHQSLFFHFLQGSLDNMTCMVVCFPGAPRPCEEAISKEMALDAVLSHKVAGEQVKWPVGGMVGQCGLSAHLLLRAVCLCSGTSMPKHGFQDPGLRGHPGLASWRRATQQVSRGEVGWGRVATAPDLLLKASLCSLGPLS